MPRGLGALIRGGIVSLLTIVYCLSAPVFAAGYGYTDKPTLEFEELAYIIESQNLTTVEDSLAAVKKARPDFFKKYVLMYRSKSLQRANFLNPRVLLFDNSARLVLTFNGDPKDTLGYQKIETMQFRDDQNRFEFREISFRPGQKAQISEANPSKCMRCHQSSDRKNIDPRPNWEPYNIWPGAYGSMSGNLDPIGKYSTNLKQLSSEDGILIAEQVQENEMLKKFIFDVKPKHSRYKFLEVSENLISPSPDRKASDIRRDWNSFTHSTVELTEYLGTLNARRIIRIMREEYAPQWAYFKNTVAGVITCSKFYAQKEDHEWMSQRAPEEFISRGMDYNTTSNNSAAYLNRYEQTLRKEGVPDQAVKDAVELERKRLSEIPKYNEVRASEGLWLLYETMGVSINDWSMDFQTQGRLAFYERFGLPSHFNTAIADALRKAEPELMRSSCSEHEAKSVKSIKEYRASMLFQETLAARLQLEAQREPLLQRCIGCHSSDFGEFNAPSIPFDNEARLKQELLKVRNEKGETLLDDIRYRLGDYATLEDQMPRGLGRPTREERTKLIKYFESLVE